MNTKERMLRKVELPQLKEYIKTVKDPLECPPIPVNKKERQEVLHYEGQFKPFHLKTQQRIREGVNKMIQDILKEKTRTTDKARKTDRYDDSRVLVKYSPMVKVGNWQEQRDVAEEDLNRFLRLRERGQLMIQRTRQTFSQTLQPISLPPKKIVHYGDNVQLIAKYAGSFKSRGMNEGLSLSCVLNGSEASSMDDTGIEGTILSASPLVAPCLRNVFQLLPEEGDGMDSQGNPLPLKYGSVFRLRYLGSPLSLPYYVTVVPSRIIPNGNASRHPQVHLLSRKCWSNAWRAYHLDPDRRKDTIGKDIPVNSDIIVTSANLNRNLCCETQCWFSTIFGIECEATAFSYLNIYGKETEQNIWNFI